MVRQQPLRHLQSLLEHPSSASKQPLNTCLSPRTIVRSVTISAATQYAPLSTNNFLVSHPQPPHFSLFPNTPKHFPLIHPSFTLHPPLIHPSFTPHSPFIHLSFTPSSTPHSPFIHLSFTPSSTPHSPFIHPLIHSSFTPHSPFIHLSSTPHPPLIHPHSPILSSGHRHW